MHLACAYWLKWSSNMGSMKCNAIFNNCDLFKLFNCELFVRQTLRLIVIFIKEKLQFLCTFDDRYITYKLIYSFY